MSDPRVTLSAILDSSSAPGLTRTSRYANVGTATLTLPDGRTVAYLRWRIVPPPETFATLQEHVVAQGERLDHIAANALGDPEQFWKLCDANGALRPEELETPGTRLRITLPEGVPNVGTFL